MILGLLQLGFMAGGSHAWNQANKEIDRLNDRIAYLESIKIKKESPVRKLFRKMWGKSKDGAKTGYGYAKTGAGKARDFSVSIGKGIGGLSGKTYEKTADYMDNDLTRKIRNASSPEELKKLGAEVIKRLDTDTVRESVRTLEKATQKCIESNACKTVGKQALVAGGGSVVGSGIIAATGMTAVGMVGGGAGVGAAAGPVGAVAGATVGLAVYGIYQAFADKEKEFAVNGDGDYFENMRAKEDG